MVLYLPKCVRYEVFTEFVRWVELKEKLQKRWVEMCKIINFFFL